MFIVIDNSNSNLSNPSHFLAVSEEKWVVINSFESGGMPVGLYAWEHNEIQAKHEDSTALINSLNQEAQLINDVPDEELSTALSKYRKKVAEVEKKTYYLPDHLKKVRRGWRIVKEKRRRRHLLRAYQVFAQQRDKMMAFAEYANKKLEVKMLKRGSVWRKRNMKLLTGLPIENI